MTTALSQHAGSQLAAAGGVRPEPDDVLTVASIALLAFVLTDLFQQTFGHALPALLTISPFGMLTATGWSSAYDNRAIDMGGMLVNFAVALLAAAGLLVWRRATARPNLLLALVSAFSLFAGAGYLVFAGLTDFGDWYSLLQGHSSWNSLRILLLAGGGVLWIASLFVVGSLLRRSIGESSGRRAARLVFAVWLCEVLFAGVVAVVNSLGVKFVLLSDFPAIVFAQIGILFVPLCMGRGEDNSAPRSEPITRSWIWIGVSAVLTIAFVIVLGRGVALHGQVQ